MKKEVNLGLKLMMNSFDVGKDITLFPVALCNPDGKRHSMDTLILFDVMPLAKEKPIDEHVVYELVRVRLIETSPIKLGKIFSDLAIWPKVNHKGKGPLDGMMMCLKLNFGATYEAPLVPVDQLQARIMKEWTYNARIMARNVDFNRECFLLDVSLFSGHSFNPSDSGNQMGQKRQEASHTSRGK